MNLGFTLSDGGHHRERDTAYQEVRKRRRYAANATVEVRPRCGAPLDKDLYRDRVGSLGTRTMLAVDDGLGTVLEL
jgi:hypothetical protein